MIDNKKQMFGFEIKDTEQQKTDKLPAVTPPSSDDGSSYVDHTGGGTGAFDRQYLTYDDGISKDDVEQIKRYRGVAMHYEVDVAIDEIVNEAISTSELSSSVKLNLDGADLGENAKKKITAEFDNIVSMLRFNENGAEMFKGWYIDGRLFHELVIDPKKPKLGIQDIRQIEATKIKKIQKPKYKKDPATGVDMIDEVEEYFLYQEKPAKQTDIQATGVKFTKDKVSYVTSGLLDETRTKVISYLHKSMRPINQLRMMEDSLIIYRLARAPERRVFYIDVGTMPRHKAEAHVRKIQTAYKNKLVYDSSTGKIRDDRRHVSMLEDFWLPRSADGKGTEISTLPGGENLGQIDDINYFQKKMYKSLGVPYSRLDGEQASNLLGRANEITRDELKFQKFIDRLRKKFSVLFTDILKKQLVLKGIVNDKEWNELKNYINIDYIRDNHYTEMRDSELLRERLQTLEQANQFVGTYFSKDWVMKNILMFGDKEIEELNKEMASEPPMEPEAEPSEPNNEPNDQGPE